MGRRWIRLDVEWDESGWIDALSGQAAGCWPRLLCWAKLRGKRGVCKTPDRGVLARRWRVTRQTVDEMWDGALQDGALQESDGNLIVVNWDLYQEPDPTASDRKRRQRERQKLEQKPNKGHGSSRVSRRDKGVTRHATPDRDHQQTAASSGAGVREATGPPDMRADLDAFVATIPDAQDRKRIAAQGELLVAGEDRKAWEIAATGGTVPPDERPELFRLALGFHRDGTQKALRSSVRYAVKLYALNGAEKPAMEGMNRAERRLAESIAKLRGIDLETAFR